MDSGYYKQCHSKWRDNNKLGDGLAASDPQNGATQCKGGK